MVPLDERPEAFVGTVAVDRGEDDGQTAAGCVRRSQPSDQPPAQQSHARMRLSCYRMLMVHHCTHARPPARPRTRSRIALLAAGDLAVLLAFAAVGRGNHGESVTLSDTLVTALPFIIGECVNPQCRSEELVSSLVA